MKKLVLVFLGFFLISVGFSINKDLIRPAHTYSIIAFDKETGQMGVAVQSHWFSVGSLVTWAEAGVGVVATQSFIEISYGAKGLEMMKKGKSAPEVLQTLLKADKNLNVRQVAMLDAQGRISVHTGKKCISEAGHYLGESFAVQANMMGKNTVWNAMAQAYKTTKGPLVDRLYAALAAAQKEGGDIRGKQSAALLIVSTKPSREPWRNVIYDLRIEDHKEPVKELKRLVRVAKAYNHMNKGDEFLTTQNIKAAMEEYTKAMTIYSGNPEMIFWPAVTLASNGKVNESLPLFKKVFGQDQRWIELLKRLPAVGQFPNDPELMKKILAVVPEGGDKL